MAAVVVSANITRLNDSDANTGWGNYNTGGGSPASEGANAYQISTGAAANTGAVGKKVNSTTAREGVDYNGTSVDYTAAANRLWYCKIYVADSFALNTTWGVEVSMGSADTSNFHQYNIAGSGANRAPYLKYPAQGGYIITCIDPTIDAWAEVADSGGATDQTAITWYALGAQFAAGNAKSENVAMDAIDYGTGLTVVGGDGATADATYVDFVTFDQDDIDKRYGAAVGSGDKVTLRGIFTIGTATATGFTDTTSVVTFPDGYHSAGLFGVNVDLQNASTIVVDDALLISEGVITTSDTRADYIVSGTSGSYNSAATIRNFRNITYTSVCDIDGANIECQLLTQASANISNTTIRTNALTSIACLQDPTFGTTTDLHDCTFVQTGAGHAIEITTAGTYDFENLFFSGYGADTTDSAAIDVTASTGTVTINVNGGDSPTYKTAGATVNVVAGAVTVQAKAVLKAGTAVGSARVFLKASDGTGPFPFEETVTSITRSTTTATVTHTAHGMATNDKIYLEGITDKTEDNWTVKQITVTGANTYTYTTTDSGSTSYTGTIKSTFVALNGLTNATTGILSLSRVYPSNQPVTGWTRKSTSSPYLQEGVLVGEVDSSTGFSGTAVMLSDE